MRGLVRYEAQLHRCGFHPAITSDKGNHFDITEDTDCPVCQTTDRYRRIQQQRDEEYEKALGPNAKPEDVRPSDGRTTTVRQLSPLEAAARSRG